MRETRKVWLAALLVPFWVIIDQGVKHWARVYLRPVGSQTIIDGLLSFTYVENAGAAFGLMQGARWFFIPLTVVMVAVIVYYYIRLPLTPSHWASRIPILFILSGAVGNFIDRARQGYVVDMFEFRFITFPVFNVADMCLVCGTLAFVFVTLFIKERA